jgi:hypothetical protein
MMISGVFATARAFRVSFEELNGGSEHIAENWGLMGKCKGFYIASGSTSILNYISKKPRAAINLTSTIYSTLFPLMMATLMMAGSLFKMKRM